MNGHTASIEERVKRFVDYTPSNGGMVNRDNTDEFACEIFNRWFDGLNDKTSIVKKLEDLRDSNPIKIPANSHEVLVIPLSIRRGFSRIIKDFFSYLKDSQSIDFGYIPGSVHSELGVFYLSLNDASLGKTEIISASRSIHPISIKSYAKTFPSLALSRLASILSHQIFKSHFSVKYSSHDLSSFSCVVCKGMVVANKAVQSFIPHLVETAGAFVDKEAASLAGSLFPKPQAIDYFTIKNDKEKISRAIEKNGALAAFQLWDLFTPESTPIDCEAFETEFKSAPMSKEAFTNIFLSRLSSPSIARLRQLHPRVGFRLLVQLDGLREVVDPVSRLAPTGMPGGSPVDQRITDSVTVLNGLLKLDINHQFYLMNLNSLVELNTHTNGRAINIVEAFDRAVKASKGTIGYQVFNATYGEAARCFEKPASKDQEFGLMYDFCMRIQKDNPPYITLMPNGVKRRSYPNALQLDVQRAVGIAKRMSFDDLKKHAFKVGDISGEVFARVCAEREWSERDWKRLAYRALKAHNPELFSLLLGEVIRHEKAPDETFLKMCLKPRLAHLAEYSLAVYAVRLGPERLKALYQVAEKGVDHAVKRILIKAGASIEQAPDARYIHPAMETREYNALIQCAMIHKAMSEAPFTTEKVARMRI